MADRIIKPDSGNDVVIQNNGGTRKIEVTNSGDVEVTGDFKATTVKATNLKANDGTVALVISDSSGDVSFNDKNISNVGDISLDTISSDAGTSIGVTLGTDAGDDLNVGSGKLVVEGDTGNVGIGTTSPGNLLTLEGASTKGLRINVSGQSYYHEVLSNGDGLKLSADTTDAGGAGADIRFEVGGSEKMRVQKNGKVGINCTPSTGNLDLLQATESLPCIRCNKSTSTVTNSQIFIEFVTGGQDSTGNGRIVGNGGATAAFASFSDKRLKENITQLTNQLDLINSLKPVEFDWKSNGEHGIGFIAQEFQEVFPKQVSTDPPTQEQIDNGETGTMLIAGWSSTEAILVSAIQELSAKVTALENATN